MIIIFFSLLEMMRSYFEENVVFLIPKEQLDSNFIIQGIVNIQKTIEGLSGQESIAAAHVVLLAAGVTIFLGVAGEAFFKRTGIPDITFLLILGVIIGPLFGIIKADVVAETTIFCSSGINNHHV
jgi:cell volume regulation protein A